MTVVVTGAQMGDEGKGGIVDLWSSDADVVVRYQGGDNAGHTVVHEGEEYRFSLVPSGAVRGKTGVLGNGCVVNPQVLFEEISNLQSIGLDPVVKVAERAHVVLPYHITLDEAEEVAKGETDLDAGTTGRGIGPTYEDRAARRGIRVGDLLEPNVLRERLEYVVPLKRTLAEEFFGVDLDDSFDIDEIYEEYVEYGEKLRDANMTIDAGSYIEERRRNGDQILFEGSQGTFIDLDHGVYPYVTSSNTSATGVSAGTGISPSAVGQGQVVGAIKAYVSRVGTGPLPTEIDGDVAEQIREKGGEFGTVTGRPRRIGWLDMPMLRHSNRVNGFDGVSIHHLDVLSGLETVKVAEEYDLDGETLETVPTTTEVWSDCEPVYREFDGWPDTDWETVANEGMDALPSNAKEYVDHITESLQAPVYGLSVGPDRNRKMVVENPFER